MLVRLLNRVTFQLKAKIGHVHTCYCLRLPPSCLEELSPNQFVQKLHPMILVSKMGNANECSQSTG